MQLIASTGIGSNHLKLALALIAGALLPLAFAPFGLFFVAPLSFAALMLAWTRALPRDAFVRGFGFGITSFLAGMYWLYISIHGFGNAPPIVAALAMAALIAILALFPAFVGWATARWDGLDSAASWLVVIPALWVLTEWCRGWVFSGMGWLAAGYSQSDSWLMGFAAVGGIHAMSWCVLVTAGAIVTVLREPIRAKQAALGTLIAVWVSGYFLVQQRWTRPDSAVVSVGLVQGAVPQDLKWQPSQLNDTLSLYRRLTEEAAGSDLIIWPEAAIPALYDRIGDYLDGIRAMAARSGSHVLLGTLRASPETGAVQNALVALDSPPSFYVKRHLVPYGEYFPVPNFVRNWLRLLELPYTDISPGAADQPPIAIAGQSLAVTICYEDLFGAEQLHYLPEATLLVNVSNDAWFGDSIAPHQHLEIARVRAAEVGRYLLRSTNTGITAIVDPSGRIVAESPQFEPAVLKGAVQGHAGNTPYALWGNFAVVSLALAALMFVRMMRRGV
jgi:apolipoprotein N-acyltransferase